MFDRVLVIGAHTDDIEMMCGGTIVKLIELGCEVHYATFSFADKSLPEGFPEGTTRDEVAEATDVLGIPMLNLNLYD
ncbi:MAG TPA: PIG-L family deacetylase, partial [Candidatus Glassbacteria bacterium]|nr:PIG-L family deacetylase [Candidatus Glassbacteria bacterium]